MIRFTPDKVKFDLVKLKSCTTALGGSIRVVDEEKTAKTGKEVYKKINVPMSIIRAFQKHEKRSRFLEPVITEVVSYEGHVLAIERAPVRNHLFGQYEWTSHCRHNFNGFIKNELVNGEWFFDGKHIYRFTEGVEKALATGKVLSSDRKFRNVPVVAINLYNLESRFGLNPKKMTALAYVASTGQYAITPPVWRTLDTLGVRALQAIENADDESPQHRFDYVDEMLAVNLAFALYAGELIGEMYGHEAMEPLQLPELMVRLHTVNLPGIAKSVKSTFDIGMKFTHAVAWLVGLSARAKTVNEIVIIRKVLKYLTTKGIYHRSIFAPSTVFKDGQTMDDIKLMDSKEALENFANLSAEELINRIRSLRTDRYRHTGNVESLGDMYVDDEGEEV